MSARGLVPLNPDVVLWACTSGSFIAGRAWAEDQVKGIAAVTGKPTSSTSIAFVNAARHLGAKRVAVLASYPERTSKAFGSFLQEHDIGVSHLQWMDAPGGRDAFLMPLERFMKAAREADGPEVDAFLVPDTAIAGFPLIGPLERELGKPVLTANQVAWIADGGVCGLASAASLCCFRTPKRRAVTRGRSSTVTKCAARTSA